MFLCNPGVMYLFAYHNHTCPKGNRSYCQRLDTPAGSLPLPGVKYMPFTACDSLIFFKVKDYIPDPIFSIMEYFNNGCS